jgi:hypothetical protein
VTVHHIKRGQVRGHLRPFGCDIHSHIHPDLRTKWKSKTRPNTFVGYIDYTTAQYRVWNGHRFVVVAASHSRFEEQSYGYRDSKLAPNPLKWVAIGEIPVKQDVLEERMEDPPSTDQEASMTIEPTLQTSSNLVVDQSNPPIATHPTTDSMEIRRSTRVKRPSFKLRSAFSVRVRGCLEPASY